MITVRIDVIASDKTSNRISVTRERDGDVQAVFDEVVAWTQKIIDIGGEP